MRVKELIEELNKIPYDTNVWSREEDGNFGYDVKVMIDSDDEVGIFSKNK